MLHSLRILFLWEICKALLDRNLRRLLNLPSLWNIMNKHMMKIPRRMTRKPLVGARDKGLQRPLVMISSCTSWMILPLLFQKRMPLQKLTTGRMRSVARWIPSWLTGHGRSLTVPMVANHWDVSGCSKRSLGPMVRLKSTRLGLWPRAMTSKKRKISLILIHLWLDWPPFEYYSRWRPHMVFSSIRWMLRRLF